MNTKNKFNDKSEDRRTAEIRAMLSFLQFIENKIINKQVFGISRLENVDHFAEFMTLYTRK